MELQELSEWGKALIGLFNALMPTVNQLLSGKQVSDEEIESALDAAILDSRLTSSWLREQREESNAAAEKILNDAEKRQP